MRNLGQPIGTILRKFTANAGASKALRFNFTTPVLPTGTYYLIATIFDTPDTYEATHQIVAGTAITVI